MSWLFSSPGSVLAIAILAQLGGIKLGDFEFGDVAAEFVQPLHRPRAHHAADAMAFDAVAFGKQVSEFGERNRPSGDSNTGLIVSPAFST